LGLDFSKKFSPHLMQVWIDATDILSDILFKTKPLFFDFHMEIRPLIPLHIYNDEMFAYLESILRTTTTRGLRILADRIAFNANPIVDETTFNTIQNVIIRVSFMKMGERTEDFYSDSQSRMNIFNRDVYSYCCKNKIKTPFITGYTSLTFSKDIQNTLPIVYIMCTALLVPFSLLDLLELPKKLVKDSWNSKDFYNLNTSLTANQTNKSCLWKNRLYLQHAGLNKDTTGRVVLMMWRVLVVFWRPWGREF